MSNSQSTTNSTGTSIADSGNGKLKRAQLDALNNVNASTDKSVVEDASACDRRMATEPAAANSRRRKQKKFSRFGLATAELDAYQVYNHETHVPVFESDFRNARHKIVLYSSYLSHRRITEMSPMIRDAIARGVIVCAFIQQPNKWERRVAGYLTAPEKETIKRFQDGLDLLHSLGVHCNLVTGDHKKLSIFDDRRLWAGSMNFASHYDTEERLERWDSRAIVLLSVDEYRLDRCPECIRINVGRWQVSDSRSILQCLGRQLAARRKFLGMTQAKLAELCDSSQPSISYLENGLSKLTADTMLRVCTALGFELSLVPNQMVDAVDFLIASRCKEVGGQRKAIAVERFDTDDCSG